MRLRIEIHLNRVKALFVAWDGFRRLMWCFERSYLAPVLNRPLMETKCLKILFKRYACMSYTPAVALHEHNKHFSLSFNTCRSSKHLTRHHSTATHTSPPLARYFYFKANTCKRFSCVP